VGERLDDVAVEPRAQPEAFDPQAGVGKVRLILCQNNPVPHGRTGRDIRDGELVAA
jgi:hypothetical protein